MHYELSCSSLCSLEKRSVFSHLRPTAAGRQVATLASAASQFVAHRTAVAPDVAGLTLELGGVSSLTPVSS